MFVAQHSGTGGRQTRGRNLDNLHEAPFQAGRRLAQK
jgi:hypothetical protein